MYESPPRYLTLDEFFGNAGDAGAGRELIDGEIQVARPPSPTHATVVANLGACLGTRISPPRWIAPSAGIRPAGHVDTYYRFDLAVTASPPVPAAPALSAPLLLIHVLSAHSALRDHDMKLPDVRRLPTLRELVIVSAARRRVEIWRRDDLGWRIEEANGGGSVRFESLGLDIPLDEIYQDSGLPPG